MAYHWHQVPGDVKQTARQVLTQLDNKRMTRLELQRVIFGDAFVGSYTMIDALRHLREAGWIYKPRGQQYKLTELGREELARTAVYDADGAA